MTRETIGQDGELVPGELLGDPLLPMTIFRLPARAELREDLLYWSQPRPRLASPERMLDSFVRIRDGKDVLRFAKRYGPLWLSSDGYPENAGRSPISPLLVDEDGNETGWCEQIEHWLQYVRLATAILTVATFAYEVKRAPEAELTRLSDFTYFGVEGRDIGEQEDLLGLAVDFWLEQGDVRPTFSWREAGWHFSLQGGTFGILGVQIMLAVSKSQGLAICDGCGNPYLRTQRKPQTGRNNFCTNSDCGEKGASKLRRRKKRALDKEKLDGQARE